MHPLTKAVTMFAIAGAATAFVPSTSTDRDRVDKLAPGALHGNIDVVSFGIARLAGDRGTPIAVVHVRETFTNRGDNLPWVVDFTAARVALGDAKSAAHPAFVNSDVATLPLLIVGRGERRVADLYFPVPADRSDDDSLRYFSVTYRIHTADHRYEASMMLGRSSRWPTLKERGAEPGWGPYWWADPTYPWNEYRHRPGYVVPKPPKQVEVIGVPRAYYEEVPAVANDVAIDSDWPRPNECDEW